jgi:hypothetical protein
MKAWDLETFQNSVLKSAKIRGRAGGRALYFVRPLCSHGQHSINDFPHPSTPKISPFFTLFLSIERLFPPPPPISYLGELGEEEIVRAQVIEGQLRVELNGLRVELVQILQILLRIVLILDTTVMSNSYP